MTCKNLYIQHYYYSRGFHKYLDTLMPGPAKARILASGEGRLLPECLAEKILRVQLRYQRIFNHYS